MIAVLFRTKCPLGTWDKTATEFRMQWFADKLGPERMRSAPVVVPTEQFFPPDYEPTAKHALEYKNIVAGLMQLDPMSCRLEVCDPTQLSGATAQYDHSKDPVIRLSESALEDPVALIFTLAHQLAQHILMEGNHINGDSPDPAHVVDLSTVFFGFGVFAANSTVRESPATRQYYVTSQVIGYALALITWRRGDTDQAWSIALRPDAREGMQNGLKYLRKTSDSIFQPDVPADQYWIEAESLRRLESGSASFRLAALWYLNKREPLSEQAVAPITQCLRDRDADVRASAASILRWASASDELAEALYQATTDRHDQVRQSAAETIGYVGVSDEALRESLISLLSDPNDSVFRSAASSLAKLGEADDEVTGALLRRMRSALISCNYPWAEEITRIIARMRDDFSECIQSYFSDDEQLQHQATEVLEETFER
jgi:hypothetical protein